MRFVPIVFGYPTPVTFEAAERGKVILGGCIVFEDMPEQRCPSCLTDLRWIGESWTPVGQPAEL